MAEDAPQTLLQSALEKIVYFEARLGQLQAQLAESRAEADRLREELAQASQREMEVRREHAGLQVQLERSRAERAELQRVHEASRQERTMLISKLLEASQIHHSGDDIDFDLASFISTLRGEVLARGSGPALTVPALAQEPILSSGALATLSPGPAQPEAAPAPPPAASYPPTSNPQASSSAAANQATHVTAHAQRLAGEGRLGVSAEELRSLSTHDSIPRSEETLLEFSIRELRAADVSAHIRAADRLRALGQEASAPALASALHQEKSSEARVALLRAFAAVGNAGGAQVVEPMLIDSDPEVRIAALKALLSLDVTQALPHLSAAVKDPDRAVRRRASLLALGLDPNAALALAEEALEDADPEVRGLAALALGASGGERARDLLFALMEDASSKVRRAAAQSLSRILGCDVTPVVELESAQRRRELRRIAGLPMNPVRTALPPTAATLRRIAEHEAAQQRLAAVVPLNAGPARQSQGGRQGTAAQAQAAAASAVAVGRATGVALAVAPAPEPDEALCAGMLAELRTALRGRTEPELCRALRVSATEIEDAVALLSARGQVVRRGLKLYLA